jgi:hypothetical protein
MFSKVEEECGDNLSFVVGGGGLSAKWFVKEQLDGRYLG